ncbi:DUF885 family protein [Glaciecola petra]|uniref:DUF885 family protein n=1 Tax=Glaciecola petra TaxID=3075602 RepID=A0ABU2ZRV8_9ALTE|nr:DUF885 family protein [Aestuariibacter sp. P117]MDT0595363.1 DUF885 family protein [Aestuariibacter sp. P117]
MYSINHFRFIVLIGGLLLCSAQTRANTNDGYEQLIALTEQFFEWRNEGDDPLKRSSQLVSRRLEQLKQMQANLRSIDIEAWGKAEKVDYLALRGVMDQQDFMLQISKPWERDPGYYVDKMKRLAFTQLPLSGDDLSRFRAKLKSIIAITDAAKNNLKNVPKDFASLAIHNLTTSDGVGHGHPYRMIPPAGVLGWYTDLLQRAQVSQIELVDDVEAARNAVKSLHIWLLEKQPSMTAEAGVGEELLDWYLMQVKFMPYTSDEVEVLGERELDRTWAFYALEQHRNRKLPELSLPSSEQEYEARIASVDNDIRQFIKTEEFMTLPDYVPDDFREIGFNVPWIERPTGPNYWEAIQFRDPSPDHWHAHIPGHRVDSIMLSKITHPIRSFFRDPGRMEGWALYLEEVPLQLGFYENRPRTRELIYNFGIFRSARTLGDIRLQRNEINIPEVIKFWRTKTPWLDKDVARVDAEIYLRRPPGYGLGYTVGNFQMIKLLADRKQQLRDKFVLGEFHDEIMAMGAMPIALMRYEMTGLEDEVRRFWNYQSLDEKLSQISN